jgi:MFS family permease
MLMMALGTFFYVIGFSMYGFVSTYALFIVAMVILTVGEMVVSPVSQALVASFAPEEMRGRYMAIAGFSWGIPFAVGPYLAGLIMDGPKPYMLWYAAGFVGTLSTLAFLALYRVRIKREQKLVAMPEAAAS